MSRVPFALLAKRLLLGLLFAFVMAFPLAAVMAWGALITVALGASLPLWAVLLIASLVAVGISRVLCRGSRQFGHGNNDRFYHCFGYGNGFCGPELETVNVTLTQRLPSYIGWSGTRAEQRAAPDATCCRVALRVRLAVQCRCRR